MPLCFLHQCEYDSTGKKAKNFTKWRVSMSAPTYAIVECCKDQGTCICSCSNGVFV